MLEYNHNNACNYADSIMKFALYRGKRGALVKRSNFAKNFIFMWKEHWNFDKLFLFLPILKIPLTIGTSLMGLILPKIVLDTLTIGHNLNTMLLQISITTVVFCVFSMLSEKVNIEISIHANCFFSLHGFYELASKKLNIDYETFSSPQGKVASKKAQLASQGNIRQGIVSFFLSLVELTVSIFGLFSFIAILTTLNPWIIVFLLLSYGIDGLMALAIEKQKNNMVEQEAVIERKVQYIAHRVTLSEYAKDIRIYSLADWLKAIRENLLDQELDLSRRKERLNFMQFLFEGFLIFIRDGLAYMYLIYQMINTDMSIGTFSVYFAAITGFGNWLYNIVTNIDLLGMANYCVSNYRAFLEMPDKAKVKNGVCVSKVSKHVSFQLKNVSYHYPQSDHIILDNISMEINAGENLALVGINGAGKSTLVKLICGLIQPTSGEIYVNGINIKEIDREEYFQLFSVVFQDINILPISISENITFQKKLDYNSQYKLDTALKLSELASKIDELPNGINTRLLKQFNRDGIELSGGEMQKLLLARAMYKDAPVLILDEPTAALDPVAENRLYLKYHDLTFGKTSIYISHRLSSTRFCDRIVLLDNGKIVESGTHQELIALGGLYAKMFEASSKYYRNFAEMEATVND